MAINKKFSIKKAYSFAASTFIENFEYYILLFLVYSFIDIAIEKIILHLSNYFRIGAINNYFNKLENIPAQLESSNWSTIFDVIYINRFTLLIGLISIMVSVSVLKALTIYKEFTNKKFLISNLFSKRTANFILTRVIFYFQILISLCLFIIPGFIWLFRYYFRGYSILTSDKELSIKEDKEIALALSKDVRYRIFEYSWIGFVIYCLISRLRHYIPDAIWINNLLVIFLTLGSIYIFKTLSEELATKQQN